MTTIEYLPSLPNRHFTTHLTMRFLSFFVVHPKLHVFSEKIVHTIEGV